MIRLSSCSSDRDASRQLLRGRLPQLAKASLIRSTGILSHSLGRYFASTSDICFPPAATMGTQTIIGFAHLQIAKLRARIRCGREASRIEAGQLPECRSKPDHGAYHQWSWFLAWKVAMGKDRRRRGNLPAQ